MQQEGRASTLFAKLLNMEDDDKIFCECGDRASEHVDGCEQCFIPGCGCREFSVALSDDEE